MNPRIVAVLVSLGLIVIVLGRGCSGPEERIRRRFDDLAADFSSGRPGPTVSHLADDFRDVSSGVGKGDLRPILSQLSLSDRTDDGTFRHRLAFPVEEMTITLDPDDPERAEVVCVGVFEELRGENWTVDWRVSITATMRDTDDGWLLWRTEHTSLEGRPFR